MTARIDVARARLARQFLLTTPHKTGADVVRALGAVQAQDYPGAKWAVAQRTQGLTNADIERELNAGRILRTHVLRPTWHFVAPEDIRWMLALTGPRVQQFMSSYNRTLGLTPAVVRRSTDAIARALDAGKCMTRQELKGEIARARVGALGAQRLAHIVMEAELAGVVCSGPMRGKQITYTLLDDRVAAAQARDRDDALLELTRRYFATRAPATPQDYAWWSGLTVADAKRGIDMAGTTFERVAIDGRDYWQPRTEPRVARSAPTAHLIPNYDEYFIGFKDRSAIGRRLGSHAAVTGGSFLISHIALLNGQIVGGWRRTMAKDGAHITLDLLTAITGAERKRLAAEADRFAIFLGMPVVLQETRRA